VHINRIYLKYIKIMEIGRELLNSLFPLKKEELKEGI